MGGSSKKNQEVGEKWLNEHPEESKVLLDILTQTVIEYTSAQINAGADMMQVYLCVCVEELVFAGVFDWKQRRVGLAHLPTQAMINPPPPPLFLLLLPPTDFRGDGRIYFKGQLLQVCAAVHEDHR